MKNESEHVRTAVMPSAQREADASDYLTPGEIKLILRILSSLSIFLLGYASIPLLIYGDAMAAFEPSSHHPNPNGVMNQALLMAILPAIAIWIPSRIVLVLVSLFILPNFILGLILIFVFPPAGAIFSVVYGFWYLSALYIWLHFPRIQSKRLTVSRRSPEEY